MYTLKKPNSMALIQDNPEFQTVNEDYKMLTESIPGGVQCCINDECFTISFISKGFLSLFGYTREEISVIHDNKYINFIYNDDREELLHKAASQLKNGNIMELLYRGKQKNGTLVWILHKGRLVKSENGTEYIHSILVDVTSIRTSQDELKISEERYRIVSEQSNNIIFEYNLKNKTVFHSPNYFKKFGYSPPYKNFPKSVVSRGIIHPEDIDKFFDIFNEVSNERSFFENELRIKTKCGDYLWCSVQVTTIFDETHDPIRIIGKIVDINDQKKEKEHLIAKSEKDTLTNLYNKGTTKLLMQEFLASVSNNSNHAMLIVDIDNFKAINDNLGHLFGDAVLSEIALKIQNLFRRTDIVGRIGGDEFLVFIKDITNIEFVKQKATELTSAIRNILTGGNNNFKISCSIGISVFPEDGESYTELFKKADNALYYAKKHGKNCYSIYDINRHFNSSIENPSALGGEEALLDPQKPFDKNIIEYIFKIFYGTKDIYTAITLILGLIGRYFNVSRAYVFENSEDNLVCNNTFEWCNEGIEPQKGLLQNVSYKSLGNYSDFFNEKGVFYCNDINSLPAYICDVLAQQNIKSIIQVAIMDNGEFKGYVGFDECKTNLYPTTKAIESLNVTAQILSTFLLKKRSQDKLSRSYSITKSVLDNIDLWAYVLNMKTYELLFINKKTEIIAPNTKIGNLCYKAFHNFDKPCENCPMKNLDDATNSSSMIVQNKVFNVWTNAVATKLTWIDGKTVCLMSCTDITNLYKTNSKY